VPENGTKMKTKALNQPERTLWTVYIWM